jgi:protoporphyrinogen oxidase
LGGGIGGLSAALSLLKQGHAVVLAEKGDALGGQLCPIEVGGLWLDLGQKQFYDRIPEVHHFFTEVMAPVGYVKYPHRTGVIYRNRILEREARFKGKGRGLPPQLLLRGIADLAAQRLKYAVLPIRHLQDQAYASKGRLFSRIFTQGFDEKLKCRPWTQVAASRYEPSQTVRQSLEESGASGQSEWWHPVGGCAALVKRLEEKVTQAGGIILLRTEAKAIHMNGSSIESVVLSQDGVEQAMRPHHIVSSLRIDEMARLVGIPTQVGNDEISFRRGVVIAYLLIDEPHRFPHTCWWVNTPRSRVGRITNYAAYHCGMVPPGKTALAFECFCKEGDEVLSLTDQQLLTEIRSEFGAMGLFDPERIVAQKVARQPLSDAASGWEDYQAQSGRRDLFDRLSEVVNLYYISRTGIDRSVHAALTAVESIAEQDRQRFLEETLPFVPAPWRR